MANPKSARVVRYEPDPSDIVPFVMEISRGNNTADILQPGEKIVTFDLQPSTTGEQAGLVILTTAGREPSIQDDDPDTRPRIGFWFSIGEDMRDSALFDQPDGFIIGVECTITTDADPSITKQFTMLIRVRNN
ncbi:MULTISPECIES: hypothetical protein [unclassified Sphingobium]|uniref:hypothetical protein n=1 Tax=unclassified Sphingobium TaxID=2611147 RepID=UPI0022245AEC|nr:MULTISPECIES: hypothetical protein [unclassified Sphingobium]MCW2395900.1 hypothetical protein [Sphingobium sp. B8D3B]MCW2419416.1 hypothetical protein [Sphingobium sp. B8D3C]